jgi:hypothetical protein
VAEPTEGVTIMYELIDLWARLNELALLAALLITVAVCVIDVVAGDDR